jgi:hypothetical protein
VSGGVVVARLMAIALRLLTGGVVLTEWGIRGSRWGAGRVTGGLNLARLIPVALLLSSGGLVLAEGGLRCLRWRGVP